MKAIRLPKYAAFKAKFDGTVYDTEAIKNEYRQFANNLQEVLLSAAAIEVLLKSLVSGYFVQDDTKRELFEHSITLAKSFTFDDARRVVLDILKSVGLNPHSHEDLSKLLRDVVNYRNELAHGRTQVEDNKFVCRFFRGEQRGGRVE